MSNARQLIPFTFGGVVVLLGEMLGVDWEDG